MNRIAISSFAAVIVLAAAVAFTWAAPVTLEGKVLCAKCSLHEKGREECQNVLVVEREGKTEQYYIAKNEAYEKLGDVCQGSKAVRVTGEVQDKDGQRWIVATEIAAVAPKG